MIGRGILRITKDIFLKHTHSTTTPGSTNSELCRSFRNLCKTDSPQTPSRFCWQQILFGSRWASTLEHVNNKLEILAVLFAKQCNAIAAQRIRRSTQIFNLYHKLYDKSTLRKTLERLRGSLGKQKRTKPLAALLGAALYSWDQEQISDQEILSLAQEIHQVRAAKHASQSDLPGDHILKTWEVIIDRDHLKVWRKPVENSQLYEYKVFGTFCDIPARAFYNVQIDLDYRKQWDKLVIDLDVVDRDENTGCEVVRWVTHYPYPMYSREYVYIRRFMVDLENKLMVMMSRSTDHPLCPENAKKYVRVNTLKTHMVIRPHANFDENGFDYVLTYYDDPQAVFPTPCYNWMASTGVPDFVNKIHKAAKMMHDRRKGRHEQEEGDGERIPM